MWGLLESYHWGPIGGDPSPGAKWQESLSRQLQECLWAGGVVWPGQVADRRVPDTAGASGPRVRRGGGEPLPGPQLWLFSLTSVYNSLLLGKMEGCFLQEKADREGGRTAQPPRAESSA